MTRNLLGRSFLLAMLALGSRVQGEEKIHVVATIPDLAEFAQRIGGDLVDVKGLATGVEDIHSVPMKPNFAVLLNRADLVVLLGLEVEHAFLPGLLEASRNPKIQRGMPAYIDCSKHVRVLEVPTRIDRALGEQHPMGNPHYNLDPLAMKEAARALAEGFGENYPQHKSVFQSNLKTLLADLDKNIARWKREAAALKGKKLVSYHPDLVYLAARFGMQIVGTIEIRAGVDATPSHVEQLIELMQREKVDVVVRELHYPAGLAETVAQRTGAALVGLPVMVGGVPGAPARGGVPEIIRSEGGATTEAKTGGPPTCSYVGLIDYDLHALVKAVGEPRKS